MIKARFEDRPAFALSNFRIERSKGAQEINETSM